MRTTTITAAMAAAIGAFALAGLIGTAAHGQDGRTASDAVSPAASPRAPAEIQPGHPASNGQRPGSVIAAPGKEGSGPQTVAPAPLPPGAGTDTPGSNNPRVVPK